MLTRTLPTYERSTKALRTWPDAYIDAWGEYYRAHPEILARGVLFETFLLAPVEILRALEVMRGVEVRFDADVSGLHRAAAVAHLARAVLEELGARCSNGALVEKMRHNRNRRDRNRRHGNERLV